jgi:hypothetical protein
MVSKYRWSLNTGKVYMECGTVEVEKGDLVTQVFALNTGDLSSRFDSTY